MQFCLFITLAVIACGLPLQAQSWEALGSLKPGDRVRILDVAGLDHNGSFVEVASGAITVRSGNGDVNVERARVRRVAVRSGSRRLRNAVIGAGIGLAIGLVVDNTLGVRLRNEGQESSGARAATYIGPIALFGGLLAARPAYQTIYRAP
jgi:hypothetical protein